jgi:hypothetical protein
MCDGQQPQTQLLLRKHRDILPKHFLCEFDLNSCSRGQGSTYVEALPKYLIQRTFSTPHHAIGNQIVQKRKKNYWSEEENLKLEEALKIYKKKGSR